MKFKNGLIALLAGFTMLLLPTITNASTEATETTKTSTGKTVKWVYNLNNNNDIDELICNNVSEITGELTIPETIDGHKVVGLNQISYKGTFEGCSGLTGITFPNSLGVIGSNAFKNCTGLKSITFPNSTTLIGDNAFYGCTGLKTINTNSVTSIGGSSFSGCSGISSLTFGNSLTSIGDSAFYNCTGITSLNIPDNVTTIKDSAFQNCSGLKTVKLSNNLTAINSETFENCSGLTEIKIPESVTSIMGTYSSTGAFNSCTNLKKILIPASVATIDKGAFYDCKNLTIFGVKGSAAETFAKNNNIPFEDMANWDEKTGSDITAPTVSRMFIPYSGIMHFWNSATNDFRLPVGAKVVIQVDFSEDIKGTAPTLALKIGEGKEKPLKNGVISGSSIIYEYTTSKEDSGLISVSKFEGGAVTDNSGNSASLSVKKLEVELNSNKYAYVDNSKYTDGSDNNQDSNNNQNTDNSNTNTNENTTNEQNNNTNTNNSNHTNNTSDTDSTTAPGKIPQTGVGLSLTFSIIILFAGLVFGYIKYRNLRKI